MKLKLVVVDFEISPRARKLLVRVGLPIAFVLGGSALAYANVPKTWNAGDPLKAADLNENFSSLDARLVALEEYRTESAVIGFNCTSTSQSGAWMTLVNNGAGDCTVLFTNGTFSSPPTCIGTSYGSNGAWPRYDYGVKVNGINGIGNPDVAGGRFRHMVVDTMTAVPNGAAANEPFAIICTGPK